MKRISITLIFLFIYNYNTFSFPNNIRIFFGYGFAKFTDVNIPDNKSHVSYNFGLEAAGSVSRTISLGASFSHSHISEFINGYTYIYNHSLAFPATYKYDLNGEDVENDICFLFNYSYYKSDSTTLSVQLNSGIYILDENYSSSSFYRTTPLFNSYMGVIISFKALFEFNTSKKVKIGFAPCWSFQQVAGNQSKSIGFPNGDVVDTYYTNSWLFRYYLEASVSFSIN